MGYRKKKGKRKRHNREGKLEIIGAFVGEKQQTRK